MASAPRNDWREALGPLTGEQVRIPDVNSGYPKGVYPTKWEDSNGAALGVALYSASLIEQWHA